MFKDYLIRGDCHGDFTWLNARIFRILNPKDYAIIILGDVGFNTGSAFRDDMKKEYASQFGYSIYCVRGNHEMRPENVEGMERIWDSNVQANVWYEPAYPLIRYFDNYGIYYLKTEDREYRTLIISGGYSVDKYYRLKNNLLWWEDEQLTDSEKSEVERLIRQTNKHFDLVLSHTCPYSWEPRDLFLPCVDQSTVDNSMELWLENIEKDIDWNIWLWAHFHCDRIQGPHCEIFYNNIDFLSEIWDRWNNNDKERKDRMKKSLVFFIENKWSKEFK